MITFLKRFAKDIGLSDHDATLASIPIAMGLGATFIERGIRPVGKAKDIDEYFASEISSLEQIIDLIGDCIISIGKPRDSEEVKKSHMASAQQSCLVLSKDVCDKEALDITHFRTGFPNLGISVAEGRQVIGKKVKKNLNEGHILQWKDLVDE